LHPVGYRLMTAPFWSFMMEERDPGNTGVPVEEAHPLMDIRLGSFLLSVPPVPWSRNKYLLRQASRDRLPDAVRLRPKTPVQGDPVGARLAAGRRGNLSDTLHPWMDCWIDRRKLPPPESSRDSLWVDLRPYSLDYWLKARAPSRALDPDTITSHLENILHTKH
jgi:asparagine synthase (glutamine-hydrolysing)